MSQSCHLSTRSDGLAAVCLACEGVVDARAKVEELEARGLTVTTGYCVACVKRYAMDSMRGTVWELRDSPRPIEVRPSLCLTGATVLP